MFVEERHEINGIDTAVLTAGEGPPIVFFHGAGTATESTRCCHSPRTRG